MRGAAFDSVGGNDSCNRRRDVVVEQADCGCGAVEGGGRKDENERLVCVTHGECK